jgi:AcrR family transcriptional regulator
LTRTKARPKSFGPDDIAEAALGILRNEGPGALSLRRVGEVLGTNHVAVYRRCGSFDGLLDMCADYVAAGFPEVPDTLDWATATQMRFEAAYDMWAEHADLILLMHGRAWLGMNMTSRFYEPAMRSIVDAGMPISEAATLFSILYRLTIGSVVATRANHWSPWESLEALKSLGVHRFPILARVEHEVDKTDDRGSFSKALRRLIVDLGSQYLEGQSAKSASRRRRQGSRAAARR